MNNKQQYNYQFYGLESNAIAVKSFIEHIIHSNIAAEQVGQKKSPIWFIY